MGVTSRTDRGVMGVLFRAKVLSVDDTGTPTVTRTDETAAVEADLLSTFEGPRLQLVPGDEVLVATPADGSRAVIFGRLSPAGGNRTRVPDELVIEAKQGLVLRVGEGSITLRADGKIVIQGKDLVSSAKKMNRIKGGAVSIN